jgi:hypothetical protein
VNIKKEEKMRKVLKWIGIILGAVIGLLLIAVAAVHGISTYRFNRTYDVQVEAVEIPSDQASIEYGEHVAAIRSCMACHGDDLASQIEFRLSYAPAKLDWGWRGKRINLNLVKMLNEYNSAHIFSQETTTENAYTINRNSGGVRQFHHPGGCFFIKYWFRSIRQGGAARRC